MLNCRWSSAARSILVIMAVTPMSPSATPHDCDRRILSCRNSVASNTVNTGCMPLITEALIAVVKFRPMSMQVALAIMMPPSKVSGPICLRMSGAFTFSLE